ncbi:hypothetical protein F4823DRAFT_571452 [Ustulina deusta]|nr:hypothetical protein F4823DRAFT_571452 [Ustulina deusta]
MLPGIPPVGVGRLLLHVRLANRPCPKAHQPPPLVWCRPRSRQGTNVGGGGSVGICKQCGCWRSHQQLSSLRTVSVRCPTYGTTPGRRSGLFPQHQPGSTYTTVVSSPEVVTLVLMKVEWTKLVVFVWYGYRTYYMQYLDSRYIHRLARVLLKMVLPPTSFVLIDSSKYITCRLKLHSCIPPTRLSGVVVCPGEVLRSCAASESWSTVKHFT